MLTVRPFVLLQLAAARQLARHRRTAWQQESANGRANASERSVSTPPQTPQSSATAAAARSANTGRPQSTPKAARTERVDGVKGEEPEETKLEDVDQQPGGEPEDVPMASPGVAFGTLRELAAERTAGISAVTKQRLQARRLPQVRRKERGAPPPQRAKQQPKQQKLLQQQHLVDELRGLADLREAGFLSPADFREAKRRVLDNR